MGIEPTLEAWEAPVLPLNYTRICRAAVEIKHSAYRRKPILATFVRLANPFIPYRTVYRLLTSIAQLTSGQTQEDILQVCRPAQIAHITGGTQLTGQHIKLMSIKKHGFSTDLAAHVGH